MVLFVHWCGVVWGCVCSAEERIEFLSLQGEGCDFCNIWDCVSALFKSIVIVYNGVV